MAIRHSPPRLIKLGYLIGDFVVEIFSLVTHVIFVYVLHNINNVYPLYVLR